MFSAQPQPTIRSAVPISSAASGEENPPEMPRENGSPSNKPLATADVATSAPTCSASAAICCPAPRAPRPATNTGRRDASSSRRNSATADSAGRTCAGVTIPARATGANRVRHGLHIERQADHHGAAVVDGASGTPG